MFSFLQYSNVIPGILQFTKLSVEKRKKEKEEKKGKQSLYFINNIFEKSLDSPKHVDSLFLIKNFLLKHAKAGKMGVSIQKKNQNQTKTKHSKKDILCSDHPLLVLS